MSSGSSPSVSNLAEGLSPSAFQGVVMNNSSNVERVQASLLNFYEEDNIVDLIADILHYCNQEEIDFEAELRMARMHFEAEQ